MAEIRIIDKTDIAEFHPISKNISDERINPYIIRAQQRELKPFLGEALYFDFVSNITVEKYQELLNGVTYVYSGNEIFFSGLKPVIAAFAYAQFMKENPVHVNRAGNKNKTDENSVEIDGVTTGIKVTEARSEAVRMQEEARRFLDKNRAVYELWQKGVNINKETKQGFSFTKVPRSIQR